MAVDSFELSFISLNTMGALFKPQRPQRFRRIVDLMSESPAQFFALQETFSSKVTQSHLIDRLHHKKFELTRGDHRNLWKLKVTCSGLSSVSMHPVVKTEFKAFSKAKSMDRLANKGVLLTRIEIEPGLEVDVYNTHLQASYLHRNENAKTRMRQLKEVADFIRTHSSPDDTILVLGDFNFKENTKEYTLFTQSLWTDCDYGFVEVMRSLHPDVESHPLHTYQHLKRTSLREKIDHKFLHVGKGWEWETELSSTEILDWDVSDHKPILTRLVFQKS